MKCNKCGHENKQGAKFCDTCGASMAGGVCPDCGHKNRTNAQFCDKCGANLKGVVKKSELPEETGKKPGLSPVLRIVIGVIGIITFIGGALRMLQYSNFSLPEFLSGSESSLEEESNITMVTYTTNPATVVEEGTLITMVFDWLANTKEQVQDFIDNAEQEVEVNGTPVITKITYSVISSDEGTGGFKTQVAAEIGNLPAGTNTIITTISWKQKITNGRESFGPGTLNEQVKEEARIIVGAPSGPQQTGDDSGKTSQGADTNNCPSEGDITAGDAVWDESEGKVYHAIHNKHGWGEFEELPPVPLYFAEEASQGGGSCYADPNDPNDDTIMICETEIDHKPSEMKIRIPYPWGASPEGYCIYEDLNIPVVDAPECPPVEKIRPGELFWEEGKPSLRVYNTLGWEPYQENPEYPSILTVNDDLYTELGCEVDADNETIMLCRGSGTIKTGGMGLVLNIPWKGWFCEYEFPEIKIMDVCPTGTFFCPFTGACCPDGHECTVSGCIAPEPPPPADDDHDH